MTGGEIFIRTLQQSAQSRFSHASFRFIRVRFERLAVVHQTPEGLERVSVVSLDQTFEFLSRLVVELDLESLHKR